MYTQIDPTSTSSVSVYCQRYIGEPDSIPQVHPIDQTLILISSSVGAATTSHAILCIVKMTHLYRRECSELVSAILKRETRVVFRGEPSAVIPGRRGVCLLLTTGAREVTEINLCRDAVIEGLYDMAEHEGIDGCMILYNIGFKFAVDPNGPLGECAEQHNGAGRSQSQGHDQSQTQGSERGSTRSEGSKGEARPGRSQSRRSSQQGYVPRGTSRGPPPPQQSYYHDGYEERLRARFVPKRSASTRERRSDGSSYAQYY